MGPFAGRGGRSIACDQPYEQALSHIAIKLIDLNGLDEDRALGSGGATRVAYLA
jgi:hypothetical protein